mmetsp:Transcript_14525/g.20322  ORF Transcript_14525/g.20322 Transcript_14525/m.20322 type:complete len:109 (+) Transcript_14525:1282-1608(+)
MEIFGASASTQQHHLTESEVKREMKRIIWRRSYSEENLLGSVTRCPEVLFPNFAISYESCLIDDQFFIKSVPYHVLDASFSFFFFLANFHIVSSSIIVMVESPYQLAV